MRELLWWMRARYAAAGAAAFVMPTQNVLLTESGFQLTTEGALDLVLE